LKQAGVIEIARPRSELSDAGLGGVLEMQVLEMQVLEMQVLEMQVLEMQVVKITQEKRWCR
jgi:hypothetical protein